MNNVFTSLAHSSRRELVVLLADKREGLYLNELTSHFQISRQGISKHLRILENAGLVRVQTIGRKTRYSLNPESLKEAAKWIAYYSNFWDAKLSDLEKFLERTA